MKLLISILLTLLHLNAGIFSSDDASLNKTNQKYKQIHNSFRQNVSDANAIIKRGEYEKIDSYTSEITSIIEQIKYLDIPRENKLKLQEDMIAYSNLINQITQTLKNKAPNLKMNYGNTLEGLQKFNKKIASIGLSELTTQWIELSRIKNHFVKKPNAKLEKEFDNKWNAVVVTITELYLDEEIENPLFNYLNSYKSYFKEISLSYKDVEYSNINKIKPLSYKIKAQLELLVPYKS
ncbi:hypothetical protein KKG72_03995 [bacterium]|nr:hypothetical protein [bacterium]